MLGNKEPCTDLEFVETWRATGGRATEIAKLLGYSTPSRVYARRSKVEKRMGISLASAGDAGHKGRGDAGETPNAYTQRVTIDGFTGRIVVFSDAHYWPGKEPSLAHRALIEVIKETKPKLVIANGDIFDGARISRFPKNGWENLPRVSDELQEACERMAEVRHAAGRARLIRTVGNHCIRFDRSLAMQAADFEGIGGFRLSDHLKAWEECMSIAINGNTMVKHRFNGGVHAGYNNVLKSGWNMITGHTHALEVKPWADYNRRRYGVQGGAIADVAGQQFAYTEDNPTPWCSGFVEAMFNYNGHLLHPNLCEVIDGEAIFKNEVVISDRKKLRVAA